MELKQSLIDEADYQSFIAKSIIDVKERNAQYTQDIFESRMYDLKHFQSFNLLNYVGKTVDETNIIFFNANNYPNDKKSQEKLFYFFINFMDELVEKKYILVYFHAGLSMLDKQKLSFLRDSYRSLPLKYYQNIITLYTVELSWAIRFDLEISLNFVSKFMKRKIVNLQNIQELSNLPFYMPIFSKFLPDAGLENSRELFSQQILGKHLSDLALSDSGVPFLILAITLYFELDENRLQTEGIFRRVGSNSEVQKLVHNLEIGNYEYVFSVKDPLVVADFLKKFFSSLPDPLFPYYTYEELLKFNDYHDSTDQIVYLKKAMETVPKVNQRVLAYMLKFFRKISQFEKINKMSPKNIGICFAPCFLKRSPDNKDVKVLNILVLNSVILAHCMEVFIDKVEEIFPDDEETILVKKVFKQKTLIVDELRQFDANEEINKLFLKPKK